MLKTGEVPGLVDAGIEGALAPGGFVEGRFVEAGARTAEAEGPLAGGLVEAGVGTAEAEGPLAGGLVEAGALESWPPPAPEASRPADEMLPVPAPEEQRRNKIPPPMKVIRARAGRGCRTRWAAAARETLGKTCSDGRPVALSALISAGSACRDDETTVLHKDVRGPETPRGVSGSSQDLDPATDRPHARGPEAPPSTPAALDTTPQKMVGSLKIPPPKSSLISSSPARVWARQAARELSLRTSPAGTTDTTPDTASVSDPARRVPAPLMFFEPAAQERPRLGIGIGPLSGIGPLPPAIQATIDEDAADPDNSGRRSWRTMFPNFLCCSACGRNKTFPQPPRVVLPESESVSTEWELRRRRKNQTYSSSLSPCRKGKKDANSSCLSPCRKKGVNSSSRSPCRKEGKILNDDVEAGDDESVSDPEVDHDDPEVDHDVSDPEDEVPTTLPTTVPGPALTRVVLDIGPDNELRVREILPAFLPSEEQRKKPPAAQKANPLLESDESPSEAEQPSDATAAFLPATDHPFAAILADLEGKQELIPLSSLWGKQVRRLRDLSRSPAAKTGLSSEQADPNCSRSSWWNYSARDQPPGRVRNKHGSLCRRLQRLRRRHNRSSSDTWIHTVNTKLDVLRLEELFVHRPNKPRQKHWLLKTRPGGDRGWLLDDIPDDPHPNDTTEDHAAKMLLFEPAFLRGVGSMVGASDEALQHSIHSGHPSGSNAGELLKGWGPGRCVEFPHGELYQGWAEFSNKEYGGGAAAGRTDAALPGKGNDTPEFWRKNAICDAHAVAVLRERSLGSPRLNLARSFVEEVLIPYYCSLATFPIIVPWRGLGRRWGWTVRTPAPVDHDVG